MQERLVTTVVFVVLAVLCKLTQQKPLNNSKTNYEREQQEELSFSSKYRALEYDQTAMKLLMEILLMQHNSLAEDNDSQSELEEHKDSNYWSSSKTNENQYRNPTEYSFQNKLIIPKNQIKLKDDSSDAFQRNIITTTFKAPSSTDKSGPYQLPSPVDSNENRFNSIPTIHPEHIIVKPYIDSGMRNSGNMVAAKTTASPTTTLSVPKNILSSKYKDSKRIPTSALNGPHVLLLHSRPFDKFTETVPLSSSSSLLVGNYRQHFKGLPTTKPKKNINSLKLVDRDHNVRSEIQLEILNRPISTRKPMTTPRPPDVFVDVGCKEATSCSVNNKNTINNIKAKTSGQKPTKVTMPTTKAGGIVGKPGIRYPNQNPVADGTSLTPSKPNVNLISALASIVDSDENDDAEDDSEEEGNEDEEYEYDENEIEYSNENDADKRKNFALNKDLTVVGKDDDDDDDEDDDDDDDDDTSSDVISSVLEEVNALI